MDRAKFQTTAAASETKGEEKKNPRTHFRGKKAKPSGRSGKGVVREAKSRHAKRA